MDRDERSEVVDLATLSSMVLAVGDRVSVRSARLTSMAAAAHKARPLGGPSARLANRRGGGSSAGEKTMSAAGTEKYSANGVRQSGYGTPAKRSNL